MRKFNTTGPCVPSKHYMVDPSEMVAEIKSMVDDRNYLTINRARQYGKTTTLVALDLALSEQYDVLSLDFQDMTGSDYESESDFAKGLSQALCDTKDNMGIPVPDEYYDRFQNLADKSGKVKLSDVFRLFDRWCRESQKPLVLIIDEVDTAADNKVFLDFLGKLRSNYIKREKNPAYRTFHSVILAGVTDVKHLKGKIRPEEDSVQNSPFNVAVDFTADMSLSEEGIRGMLDEYEADHLTGMDTAAVARTIREYTNGYPFLVSRICQLVDESVSDRLSPAGAWTRRGIGEAVKLILEERNTLFASLTKNLNNYPDLKASIRGILMEGTPLPWNPDQDDIARMQMHGLIRNHKNTVRIDNRIFETRLYNLFLSDEELKGSVFAREGGLARNMFVKDGGLDVRLVLERFIVTYTQVKGPLKERFRERDGREDFLLYLKAIINGTGNYYIEAQTRDERRTDIIVDYLGQQYVIELKIWRGERYNAEGERQISAYLDYWNLQTGYMLSFNFNKGKEQGVRRVQVGDKVLFEGTL